MNPIGIYEKALPLDMDWGERLRTAKALGFDFIEMSIDETDHRLARLKWSIEQRRELVNQILDSGVRIPSICLSGHRRYPLGSHDAENRSKALELMRSAIAFASDIGVRVIQLAGYDVYYEDKNEQTHRYFVENLKKACRWAAEKQIVLAIEIMDDPYINSITKYLSIASEINSPWLYVYPDIGNLSAWGNNVNRELNRGRFEIAAIHLKDTLAVSEKSKGKFKGVPFGAGCVDFAMCLKTLNAMEYNGPFLIEMWSEQSPDWRKEVGAAIDFLVPILKEAGYDYGDKLNRGA
jgi:L-ribulose-5-phosphate 3-epimerase